MCQACQEVLFGPNTNALSLHGQLHHLARATQIEVCFLSGGSSFQNVSLTLAYIHRAGLLSLLFCRHQSNIFDAFALQTVVNGVQPPPPTVHSALQNMSQHGVNLFMFLLARTDKKNT